MIPMVTCKSSADENTTPTGPNMSNSGTSYHHNNHGVDDQWDHDYYYAADAQTTGIEITNYRAPSVVDAGDEEEVYYQDPYLVATENAGYHHDPYFVDYEDQDLYHVPYVADDDQEGLYHVPYGADYEDDGEDLYNAPYVADSEDDGEGLYHVPCVTDSEEDGEGLYHVPCVPDSSEDDDEGIYHDPFVAFEDEDALSMSTHEDELLSHSSGSTYLANPNPADDNEPITKAQATDIAASLINDYHRNEIYKAEYDAKLNAKLNAQRNAELANVDLREDQRMQAYLQWRAESEANNEAQVADYEYVARFAEMVAASVHASKESKNISDIGKEWLFVKCGQLKDWVRATLGLKVEDPRLFIPPEMFQTFYETAEGPPTFLRKSTMAEIIRLRQIALEWGFTGNNEREEQNLGPDEVDQMGAMIDASVARIRAEVEQRAARPNVRFDDAVGYRDIITSPADAFKDRDVEAARDGTKLSGYRFDGTNVYYTAKDDASMIVEFE